MDWDVNGILENAGNFNKVTIIFTPSYVNSLPNPNPLAHDPKSGTLLSPSTRHLYTIATQK